MDITHEQQSVNSSVRTATVFLFPDGRMDAKNAATYLGLAPKTLAMWRSQGKGPSYTKRGRIFYFKNDLDEWLNAGRSRSTAQRSREAA